MNDLKQRQIAPFSSAEDSGDVTELQAELQHYKNIIDDTVSRKLIPSDRSFHTTYVFFQARTLNGLQSHIEKEEINWRCQLQAKDVEIENLKEKHVSPVSKSFFQSTAFSKQNDILFEIQLTEILVFLKTKTLIFF